MTDSSLQPLPRLTYSTTRWDRFSLYRNAIVREAQTIAKQARIIQENIDLGMLCLNLLKDPVNKNLPAIQRVSIRESGLYHMREGQKKFLCFGERVTRLFSYYIHFVQLFSLNMNHVEFKFTERELVDISRRESLTHHILTKVIK